MLLLILIIMFEIWLSDIQYIDGKWVNVKKLEEERKRKHPNNSHEYYCKIDPYYAEQYDECWKTNFKE